MQPEALDTEDFESVDAFNLDWELSARKWFHELLDEETGDSVDGRDLGDIITVTLSDLFEAGSTLVFEGLIQSAWIRGEADIEEEIAYFEILSRPWEEAPSDKQSKRRKQQSSKQQPAPEQQQQALKRPEVMVDGDSSSDNDDPTYHLPA